MNTAASNSTTNADQNPSIVTSSTSQSNHIPKANPSDNSSSIHPHQYMNMAAVAAAFLQGGYNPHMSTSSPSSFANMHQPSQGHTFFPPPPPGHAFSPELSHLSSIPKPFASPLSVPLQSHRISRSPNTSSDKSLLDDSGIGGMFSSPNSTPNIDASKQSPGNSSGTNSLKRKLSGNISQQSVPSTNANGTGNNSVTPTSTMTRTHQYKKVKKTQNIFGED